MSSRLGFTYLLSSLLRCKLRYSGVAGAVLTAICSSTVSAQPAVAQPVVTNETDEKVEVIAITGSRRNDRTVADSAVPVDVLPLDDLLATGQLEVNQILANILPSFNYPNATIADGTDHAKPAVLRGLAPDHTLILINGKRRHAGALLNLNGTVGRGSTAVDLNNIPTAAIERVEVLRDGAAAQYGSDAIAGVINIILKDGENSSMSISYGEHHTEMSGSPELVATHVDDEGDLAFVTQGSRKVTDGAVKTYSGTWGTEVFESGFLQLSVESRDKNPTNRSGFDPREQFARDQFGALDPREFEFDRINHKFGKAKVEDISLFYNFGVDLTSDIAVYSFASHTQRDGLSAGFYRRAQDSRNVIEIYPEGFLPHIATDVTDQSMVAGIKYALADWNWDSSINYGKNDFGFSVENSLNTSMGVDSPTDFDNGSLIYEQLIFNINGDRLFDWGIGDGVFLATGIQYRKERYQIVAGEPASYLTVLDDQGDPVAAGGAQVLSGFSPESATDSKRHNTAVYVEVDSNINDQFHLAVAGRYEEYSDFGSTLIAKVAGRYELNDRLAFRGAIGSGFRAPSLAQSSYKSVTTVFENGIPNEVGIFPVNDGAARALGAETLTAEESSHMTLGLVYGVDQFNLTIDAYRIDINDRIVLSENLSGTAVEEILQNAGEFNVQRARYFTNAIDTVTDGIDVVATYDLDLDDWGKLQLSAAYNVNRTEVRHIIDNPPELSALGDGYQVFSDREITRFEEGTPDNKLNITATYHYDDWRVKLRLNRFGEVVDPSSDPANHEVLSPAWITDLDVSIPISSQLTLAVGANNLFDQYPQDTVSNVGYTTFNQIFPYSGFSAYSIDGRFIYATLTFQF